MHFSALELANKLGGKIEGDTDVEISSPAKIEEAQKGNISFIANPKYISFIDQTKCSLLVVSTELEVSAREGLSLLRVENPYKSFAKVLALYNKEIIPEAQIHPSAVIEESAIIAEGAFIGPNVYIGSNANIGENVRIHANSTVSNDVTVGVNSTLFAGVHVYHDCEIGANVRIHAGTVIGSDGFGFANADGTYDKVPQIGNVVIEDQVEIGSNCSIDRATLGSTIIKKGVKLDNLIQVAHNVVIGAHTVIAAQTGISGSTKLGKNCMIGGQVGFIGHIEMADGTMIAAQSGIAKGTTEAGIWSGSPAIPHNENKKSFLVYKQLPDIYKRLKALEEASNTK